LQVSHLGRSAMVGVLCEVVVMDNLQKKLCPGLGIFVAA
jgi:hypothetical protein